MDADILLTESGRASLVASAQQAVAENFKGEIARWTTVFRDEQGMPTVIARSLEWDGKAFSHLATGDPRHASRTGSRPYHVPNVPNLAYESANCADVVQHIAGSHVATIIDHGSYMGAREKAALIELAYAGVIAEEYVARAAFHFRSETLLRTVLHEELALGQAGFLHRWADGQAEQLASFTAERAKVAKDRPTWVESHGLKAPETLPEIARGATAKTNRIRPALEGDIDQLQEAAFNDVKLLKNLSEQSLGTAEHSFMLAATASAAVTISQLSRADPLSAVAVLQDLEGADVPDLKKFVSISTDQWKRYAQALTDDVRGVTPYRGGKEGLLEAFAASADQPKTTHSARAEFLATMAGVRHAQQIDTDHDSPRVSSIIQQTAARAKAIVAKTQDLRAALKESDEALRALGGSDLTGVPLRVAAKNVIEGKATLGELVLKARAHDRTLAHTPERDQRRDNGHGR